MNATIYPTILTALGIVITLIVTMHNLAKTTQQETNRRIDDLKNDLKELLDAKFKVIDSQFEVVNVKFQKLEGDVADVRQEVQDIKRVIFKPAARSVAQNCTELRFAQSRKKFTTLPICSLDSIRPTPQASRSSVAVISTRSFVIEERLDCPQIRND